jgi:hypothetical protein
MLSSVAGNDEDQPDQRIDVEQVLVGSSAGNDAVKLIEQSAVGRRQQFPGNRAEKWRRHKRGRDQRADELPTRHIGARHQPSHGRGDGAADHGGAGRKDRRGQQRVEEVGIGEQRDEVLQRHVAGFVREAVERKPRHRQQDQRDQKGGEQPEDRLGPVDSGLWGFDALLKDCHWRTDLRFLLPEDYSERSHGHTRNSRA